METYEWAITPTTRTSHALWATNFNLRGSVFMTKSALMVDLHSPCCSDFMVRATHGNAWVCEACEAEHASLYTEESRGWAAPTTWFEYSPGQTFEDWATKLVKSQVNPLTAVLLASHWHERFETVLRAMYDAREARATDLEIDHALVRSAQQASGVLLAL